MTLMTFMRKSKQHPNGPQVNTCSLWMSRLHICKLVAHINGARFPTQRAAINYFKPSVKMKERSLARGMLEQATGLQSL